jgi:hypothetical protein
MPITINGTTGISGVDGSAATPPVTGADTDTGIFFPDVNTVAIASGGTERLRVDSSGNVGIGTTTPNYRGSAAGTFLAVAGTSAAGGVLELVNINADATSNYSTVAFIANGNTLAANKSIAQVEAFTSGTTAANRGGTLIFVTKPDGAPKTERMRIDNTGAITQTNATSGAGAIVGEQTFQLTGTPAAIGPTIADFFGATSSINLEASSTYQITAYCVFLKTTAGTVTWTMTASSAPTRMAGSYVESPVGGIGSGGINTGFTGSQAATTAAFPATNSLTTGVNHVFQFTMQVQTNAATNFRMQITNNVSGTATPVIGSYYTVKKISASTGTFV